MLSLIEAIYAAFIASSPCTTAFPGGLCAEDEAPDGTATAYLVYSIVGAPNSPRFGGKNAYEARIQFTAIGAGGIVVLLGKLETFVTAFDETLLTLTGTPKNFDMRRLDEPMPLPANAEVRDPSALRVSAAFVTYAYNVL